jgi:hypothetical protein
MREKIEDSEWERKEIGMHQRIMVVGTKPISGKVSANVF